MSTDVLTHLETVLDELQTLLAADQAVAVGNVTESIEELTRLHADRPVQVAAKLPSCMAAAEAVLAASLGDNEPARIAFQTFSSSVTLIAETVTHCVANELYSAAWFRARDCVRIGLLFVRAARLALTAPAHQPATA